MPEWEFAVDPGRPIAVCRLISYQRRVVDAAQLINRLSGIRDASKSPYSSSVFLAGLDRMISAKSQQDYDLALTGTQAYVRNAAATLLSDGATFGSGIRDDYLKKFQSFLSRPEVADAYVTKINAADYQDRVIELEQRIDNLRSALSSLVEPNFKDLLEAGLQIINQMHEIAFELIEHNKNLRKISQELDEGAKKERERADASRRWRVGIGIAVITAGLALIKVFLGK